MAHHGNRWKQASLLLLLSSHVGNMWSEFIPYILKFMLADIYYNNEFLIGQRGTVMLLRERRSPHSWNSLSALLGYACDATKASAEANKERSQTCRKEGRNKHNDREKNPSPPFFLEFNKCIIYFPKCFLFMLPHHPILSHSVPSPIPVRWQPGAHQGMINHPVRVCSSSDLCFHINWGHSCLSLRAGETLGWGFSLNLLSENGPWPCAVAEVHRTRAHMLAEHSAAGGDVFSLSPSVGTLLYWQPGATSAPVLPGGSTGPPASCDALRSSRLKDTMRKMPAETTTTVEAKKTWKYWPVLSTRAPATAKSS